MAVWAHVNMFEQFIKTAVPVGFVGLLLLSVAPGLAKLIPMFFIGGTIWATFQVAKGFATADVRRETENW